MTDNNALFIIPARGGSKGIPRKNIKELCGKPLIHYSIEVARALAPDSHIIVSTDDDEIRHVAELTGLKMNYRRPAALGGDTVGSREVILDAMDYADHKWIVYDKVILLQPTSPMRTVEDVEGCIKLYRPEVDMVVSVTQAACNPYYDCFETGEDGCLHISKGDGKYTRRQDVPKAWQYNGAVYVINPDSIRKMGLGEFPVRIPYEMPRSRSVDLDTPIDWKITEMLMKEANK
ncbi:MAG: acylneuraminate cytidylyltransferase family protein [Duncaniella sp.]|nr:acylneuraminate cytidylyltransferase family protein [Muribaculum sp.]MCM1256044.1 acylneuraminate cytidylyltransferase family protein [Duncaniella sp.]